MRSIPVIYDSENGTRIRIFTRSKAIQECVRALRPEARRSVMVLPSARNMRRDLRKPPEQENEVLPRRMCKKDYAAVGVLNHSRSYYYFFFRAVLVVSDFVNFALSLLHLAYHFASRAFVLFL